MNQRAAKQEERNILTPNVNIRHVKGFEMDWLAFSFSPDCPYAIFFFLFFCSNWFYDEEDKCQAGKICMINCNIWQNVKEDLTLKEMFVLLGSAEVSGCDSAISNSFNLGNRGLNHLERTEYVRAPHSLAAPQSKNWMLNSFFCYGRRTLTSPATAAWEME